MHLKSRTHTWFSLWQNSFPSGLRSHQPTSKSEPLPTKSLKTYGLWRAQVLETSQHCLRIALVPWLLKWLKDSLCVDLERHLGCAEPFALCFAKELGVQWFTVAICELQFLWTIKPSLLFLQEVWEFCSQFIYNDICFPPLFWLSISCAKRFLVFSKTLENRA